jgi:hypothetical protein
MNRNIVCDKAPLNKPVNKEAVSLFRVPCKFPREHGYILMQIKICLESFEMAVLQHSLKNM